MPHLIDDVDGAVADGQAQVVQADIDDWTSRRGTGRRDAAATGQQGWMPMLNAAEWRLGSKAGCSRVVSDRDAAATWPDGDGHCGGQTAAWSGQ